MRSRNCEILSAAESLTLFGPEGAASRGASPAKSGGRDRVHDEMQEDDDALDGAEQDKMMKMTGATVESVGFRGVAARSNIE